MLERASKISSVKLVIVGEYPGRSLLPDISYDRQETREYNQKMSY
ncbi:hypothetical protein DI53_1914 [Sphingobacterium deserti]|uniref:Uncharacterized protein n=1 Tax=Sphingobacterium deserti TaxID=1229276 RepID=A0A0B8T8N4_9SPHI|nr:hypothetical protein DI53_1914 [Sphingobacterium deserti]